MNTWQLAWRLATYRPWLFAASVALWAGVHAIPVLAGLATAFFFDALTGDAPLDLDPAAFIALLVAVEGTRMAIFFGAAVIWTFYYHMLMAVLRTNMLGWVVTREGLSRRSAVPGEMISAFRDDTESFVDFIDTWLDVIGTALFAVVAVAIMFTVSPLITLVVILPLFATVLITRAATSRIRRYRREYRASTAAVTSFIGDAFGAIQAVKVAAAEDPLARQFSGLGEVRRKAAVRDRVFSELLASYSMNAGNLGLGLVLLLSVNEVRDGSFTVGEFALFATYLTWLTGLPRWTGWLLARHRQAGVSSDRMIAIMKDGSASDLSEPAPLYLDQEPPALVDPPVMAADRLALLEVEGLGYLHPGGGRGFRDVSFRVPRGSFTVITGRLGSGKSTLVQALIGLIPAGSGAIRWNGERIDDPAAFMVPPRCAYTPQVPRLLSEPLGANILLGLEGGDARTMRAAYLAALDEDIAEMDLGLETPLGPRGVRLSGGQIQRTAAARMFARAPELLVFDDISSALDVETEARLWSRLFESGDATCLVVSNRHTAYERADQIIVLAEGEVIGRGTLSELLETCPEMRALWGEADSGGER